MLEIYASSSYAVPTDPDIDAHPDAPASVSTLVEETLKTALPPSLVSKVKSASVARSKVLMERERSAITDTMLELLNCEMQIVRAKLQTVSIFEEALSHENEDLKLQRS